MHTNCYFYRRLQFQRRSSSVSPYNATLRFSWTQQQNLARSSQWTVRRNNVKGSVDHVLTMNLFLTIITWSGIRVLSISWVVLSHMFLLPLLANLGDSYQAVKISKRSSFDIILNGFPSVDSFFVMRYRILKVCGFRPKGAMLVSWSRDTDHGVEWWHFNYFSISVVFLYVTCSSKLSTRAKASAAWLSVITFTGRRSFSLGISVCKSYHVTTPLFVTCQHHYLSRDNTATISTGTSGLQSPMPW